MEIDIPALAAAAVAYLHSVSAGVTANAVWQAIAGRFTTPGRRETLDRVAENPGNATQWEILRLHLDELLHEDRALREELAALLPDAGAVSQQANITGHGNTAVQIAGDGNTVLK